MTAPSSIARNLAAVRARLAAACLQARRRPQEVELLAVSKGQPAAAVRAALAAGQTVFGENRVQELVAKALELADAAALRWQLIGSLQTNKVRELLGVPGLSLVHSLDRKRLGDELQRELDRAGRRLPVLLQIHATGEPSKHGCAPDQAQALLSHVLTHCRQLSVEGVMAMGPALGDARPVFDAVARTRETLRIAFGLPLPILSLGMSGDLEAAVAAGSTMVRIGTAVFGERRTGE